MEPRPSPDPLVAVASSPGRATFDPSEEAERLVLAAVRACTLGDGRVAGFALRRARVEMGPAIADSAAMSRVLDAFDGQDAVPDGGTIHRERVGALVVWAGRLEARGRLRRAADVLQLAQLLCPTDPELPLHEARAARKAGDARRADACYERVASLDATGGHLSRMARIGQALLSDRPEGALTPLLAESLAAGDRVAAAVVHEERARLARAEGRTSSALVDYAAARELFEDPVDRGRVGHESADLLVARGDLDEARRMLRTVERSGHRKQAALARARLWGIARAQGDQLGLRRYADAEPAGLVSLAPSVRRSARPGQARAGASPASR